MTEPPRPWGSTEIIDNAIMIVEKIRSELGCGELETGELNKLIGYRIKAISKNLKTDSEAIYWAGSAPFLFALQIEYLTKKLTILPAFFS